MLSLVRYIFCIFLFLPYLAYSQTKSEVKLRLSDINTLSPRSSMQSFMDSMNLYHQGIKEGNFEKEKKILSAIRCLDMEGTPYMLREEKGKEIAIFLKEVIDRIALVRYSEIPDKLEEPLWKFKNTEITLVKITTGERTGEWLFSRDTVYRAKEFYDKVKELPYIKGSGKGAGYKPPFITQFIPAWSNRVVLGSSLWQWIGIVIAFLIGYLIQYIGKFVLYIGIWIANKTKTQWDNLIIEACWNPAGYLTTILFWFLCLNYLKLDGGILKFLSLTLQALAGIFVTKLFYNLSDVYNLYVETKYANTDSHYQKHILPLIGKTIKVLIIIIGSLWVIQSLGFNIMSLLAGLGIGGLAFALAAKDTAANLFGSLMILFDKPFKSGDQILVGSHEGIVEDIGLRSTRLRTFYDSVVSIPNSDMANARIDNLGLRKRRRVLENISLAYHTDPDKISKFVAGITNILIEDPDVWEEKYYVSFNKFNDSTLNLILYFFLNYNDFGNEVKHRQRIFLKIMNLAKELGVELAVPTREIHVNNEA